MNLGVVVINLKEIAEELSKLPAKLQKKHMRRALRTGAVPIRNRARQLVPVLSGTLKKSISVAAEKKGTTVRASVYIQRSKAGREGRSMLKKAEKAKSEFGRALALANIADNREADPRRYAHLVEFGSKPHKIKWGKRTIDHPGAPARPFMRPAYDEQREESVREAARVLREALSKEAAEFRTKNKPRPHVYGKSGEITVGAGSDALQSALAAAASGLSGDIIVNNADGSRSILVREHTRSSGRTVKAYMRRIK